MFDELFAYFDQSLPMMCDVEDLIRVGVYKSRQAAYNARKRGKAPPYLQIPGRGLVYPKETVLSWLRENSYGFAKNTHA